MSEEAAKEVGTVEGRRGELALAVAALLLFGLSGYALGVRCWGRPPPPVYLETLEGVTARGERFAVWERDRDSGRGPPAYMLFVEDDPKRAVRFHPAHPEVLEWPGGRRVVLPPGPGRTVIFACKDGRVLTASIEEVLRGPRSRPGGRLRIHLADRLRETLERIR